MTVNKMIYNALTTSGKQKAELIDYALNNYNAQQFDHPLSGNVEKALSHARKVLRQKKKGCNDMANVALRVAWTTANEVLGV